MAFTTPTDDKRCVAKSKASGKRCNSWAIEGGTVCYMHGGASPIVKAAAQQRVHAQRIAASAQATLAHEGISPVEDPLEELGRLASASNALMQALGARVNALSDLEHFDAKNSPAIKAEVQMYERAMDRTHRLLDSLVKHGYTEREIKIQETQVMLVSGVIKRVLSALGLSAEQQKNAQVLLATEFRQLEARAVPSTQTVA